MNGSSWDGHDLLGVLRHAGAMLHAQVDEVNALNVFPVPDGDTGTNMLATIRAAISEAESVPEAQRSVPRIAAALSLGALMGARGNSGVILSQLFRGLAEAIGDTPRIGGPELAEALRQGSLAAFAAVAQPVEGTILSVARDVARAATRAAEGNGTLDGVVAAAAAEAAAAVARTPSQLAVLRLAGVVDAGGKGLELLLIGALAATRGEQLPQVSRVPHDIALPSLDGLEAQGYGYETVFVVMPEPDRWLDIARIRARLAELGESVLVAGDERAVKVHVHNERPDDVIAFGLSLGTLSRISVENLDRQAGDVRERVRAADRPAPPEPDENAAPAEGPAVIAVVAGDGLARVFSALGVSAVVHGGQSANPSAGELADAIRGSGAADVIVLPNNPNVRMAAHQAADLCPDVNVEVVATRNAAEGVAAMLAFDPELSPKDAARFMAQAAGRIQSLQVTMAVRDARMGRRKVRRGEYIVLGNNEGLVAADRERAAAVLAALRRLKSGFELLTIYRGHDVDHASAEQLRDAVRAAFESVEVDLVEGGQPHYDFLISAE